MMRTRNYLWKKVLPLPPGLECSLLENFYPHYRDLGFVTWPACLLIWTYRNFNEEKSDEVRSRKPSELTRRGPKATCHLEDWGSKLMQGSTYSSRKEARPCERIAISDFTTGTLQITPFLRVHLKVPMTWKIIVAYLTDFSNWKNYNDIFLFGISFFVLEVLTFFYYAN